MNALVGRGEHGVRRELWELVDSMDVRCDETRSQVMFTQVMRKLEEQQRRGWFRRFVGAVAELAGARAAMRLFSS
jgi:hypothetical protein